AVYPLGGLELHPTRSDRGHSKLESDSCRVPGHSKLESDSAVYQVGGLKLHPTRSDRGHSSWRVTHAVYQVGELELHPTRSDGGHSKLESDSCRVPGRWTRVTSDSLLMEATSSWRVTHAVYQVGELELHPTRSDGGHSKLESDSCRVPGRWTRVHPTRSDRGHSKLLE
ncbi:hypothetical protein RRG08_021862, partial [Elysia crispata]